MKPTVTIFEAIHIDGIEHMNKFANVRIAYGVDRQQCLKMASESDAIIVKSVIQVDKELLLNSPRLRVVGRAGTGVDNIDILEAKKSNVEILTVPTGNIVSAAEFTLLQILLLCRRIPEVINSINKNDFRRNLLEGRELYGLKVGLVGLGNVGMLVLKRLRHFGCKTIGWDPYLKDRSDFIFQGGIYADSFDHLLSEVDIISFHARLTKSSFHMMGRKQFQRVKNGLLLINCARANLIDQDALLEYIDNGKVAMASLDVLDPEPPFDLSANDHNYSNKLLKHPRIFVTPHIGASTLEAQKRISIDLSIQLKNILTDY